MAPSSRKAAARKSTGRKSTARKSASRKSTARKSTSAKSGSARPTRRWSAEVTKHSDALDLEEGVFKKRSPRGIALSLKRSAEHSKRRKGTPYQSAMSMLTFQLNRAGKGMSEGRRRILEDAKDELRKAFGRA